MKGPSEGTGDDIEEICISQLSYFSGGSLEKVEHRIFVELSEGDAFTLPIRFCPMCGERFPEVVQDSLESIKEDMALGACEYAKKRGIGHGVNASDKQAACASCEWGNVDNGCGWLMRNDLANRLGKLLDEEDKR